MIASAHISAGLVAGMAGPRLASHRAVRIAAAFLIGLASHVVLDAIPHSDYPFLSARAVGRLVVVEGMAIGMIGFGVLRRRVQPGWLWPMLAGVAGAAVADVRFGLSLILPAHLALEVTRAGYWFHSWFHAEDTPLRLGVATEIVSTVILLAALFAFPRHPTRQK